MGQKFFKKYDWIKIYGLLTIVAIDILIIWGIASLFSTCAENSKVKNKQNISVN